VAEQAGRELLERLRESMEAANRRDFDRAMEPFAADACFDVSAAGVGRFEGAAAVRSYIEDWVGAYEWQRLSDWQGSDLGNGVVFAEVEFDGRPRGSAAYVRERWAFTVLWSAGRIATVIARGDLEDARKDAERLAASRR
jgi:hypothetical protein